MEQKKLPLPKGFLWKILAGFYFLFCFYWLIFPVFLAISVIPYAMAYMMGWDDPAIQLHYFLLVTSGYVLAAINLAYLIWHFLIRRRRSNVYENKKFLLWVWITNAALFLCFLHEILQPINVMPRMYH